MRNGDREEIITGGVFVACGLWFLIGSIDLSAGTLSSPGPGLLPRAIAGILVLLGLFLALRSLAVEGRQIGQFGGRPLFIVLLAMTVFALMIDRLGILVTSFVAVFTVTFADISMRHWQRLVLSVLASAFTTIVFVYLVGLPIPVLPKW